MAGKLRIIGGQWRSRQIAFADVPGLRPTPSRVRETLFNWLQRDIESSRCLDLYAGSGALGFEAASRGAAAVVQVENNPLACRMLHDNVVKLQAGQIRIVTQDVLRFLSGDAGEGYDLVFLDPPFGQQLVATTCQWLEDKNWLAGAAKIYIEAEKELILSGLPANWVEIKHQTAGEVGYWLFRRSISAT